MSERNVGAAVAPGQLTRTQVKPVGQAKGAVDRAIVLVAYVVLIAVTLVMFVPFAFTLVTSLKTNQETNNLTFATLLWPENPTLDAYRTVFEADVGRWFFNSAFVATLWVFGRCVFDTMAGYAFARMQFPGRQVVFLAILSTLMVPGIVLIIPRFIILDRLNLLNSYGALTIPFISSAFGIFLMKQFFESIPAELEEAARVDGANRFRMFAQIILPNTMPALITLTIFTFQASWNAFLEPLIYISNSDFYTLPLGLAFFRYEFKTDWPTQMAIAVITTVPIAIFFVVFQRYFVESNASSGIKG